MSKREPKGSLLGAQSVTFGSQLCESGPLLKHQQGLCFHHIMRVRAPPFSVPKSTREPNVRREWSFSHFCLHFWRPSEPKGAPKEPKGSPKGPKGAPKPPPGRLKTIKKSTWDTTWAPKGAREAPGVPPGGKMAPKSMKKTTTLSTFFLKKGSISSCFLNDFGQRIGCTVPKKKRAFSMFLNIIGAKMSVKKITRVKPFHAPSKH